MQTQKLLKINFSFITSNDFRRLCMFVFVMPTSKNKYQCFLILVQSFMNCLYIFKNLCVDCFRYKLSSVWSYIFLLNGPDKKPKQNSSKTKRHSQQQEAKSVRRRAAVSQRNFFFGAMSHGLCTDWLDCIQNSCPIFLKLGSLPICKGKPYLKLSKLILNWTVHKH